MTQIVYETFAEAVLRAQDARERLELFTRPVELIVRTQAASIHGGWTLEFDDVAALAHAMNQNLIVSVCCECGKTLGEKDPVGARPGISHGICTRCAEAMRASMLSL